MIGLKSFVLVLLVLGADFKILTGTVDTFENFHFLARFCFRPHNGKASFTFTYRRENVDNILPTYNSLLMYYDGIKQWDAAYKTPMACHEKVDLLEDQNDSDQIAELRETDERYCSQEDNTAPLINCTSNFENKKAVYAVGDPNIVTFHNGYIGFQNSRARWWYFAVSNCDNPNGVTRMSYTVELTNGDTFWTRHVSADEIGILETDIVFVILFIYLVIASAKVARTLANRQLYHTSFKIFMASVTMQAISQIVVVIFRCMINMNGQENKVLKYFGKAIAVIAETLFILLLILLSKGWTVVRGRLSTQGTMILSASITFYFLSQVVALFWSAYMFDPGEVLYEYESAPGYVVIACLTLMWIWFCTCNYHTLQNYPDQNKFYGIFFAAYSIWFLAKPIMVLIAAFQLEDHYREKAVNVVLNSNHFFGYSVFLVLTRPSTNNKMFPYNVKTSQIGVSGTADDLVDGERPKASSFERANMFRAARTVDGGRGDAYAVGFSSVAYNAETGATNLDMFSPYAGQDPPHI
ncbi:transmembrane protein 145-like isoform X1 [Bolinopsis microptera]|uniref:transmembrane protein 145-like isoform X1 n=1 Tax=Bolinopsis microptera TaxID=2820187 RepID=UPI0030793FFC